MDGWVETVTISQNDHGVYCYSLLSAITQEPPIKVLNSR